MLLVVEGRRAVQDLDLTTRVSTGTAVIVVVGDVDLASAPALHEAIAASMRANSRTVVDLTESTFFDGSGLRVLLTFAAELHEVRIPREGIVTRLFDLTAVDQVLPVRRI